jgi:thiol-disulfide isomerase/thioredoxin
MLRTTLVGCVVIVTSLSAVCAEDDPLKELGERYAAQQKLWQEASRIAKTDKERTEIFNTLHPANALVEDFVTLEQSHRGQPAGISALYQLIRHATSVWDPETPASQGGVKAIRILRDHYLEHPDLSLLLGHFSRNAVIPEAEGLLRDAAKSPHAQVRASARYQLARFLKTRIELEEDWGPDSTPPDSTTEDPTLVTYRRILRDQVKKMAIDPTAARAEAIRLIEQIIAEDPDIVRTFVVQEDPGKLSICRSRTAELGQDATTYATIADAMRFELEHLQKGQVVPEIDGKDADGIEFKLSDYRGRVLLLMFSANWCGPCKAMYPDIRKVQAEFEAQPFTILAVMGDQQIDTVIQDTKTGDIRWRTWFDGHPGPISKAWHIEGWPTLFLIDHNGVIISRRPSRHYEELKEAIVRLLAAQEADPQAEAQLKAHSLPELPILKRKE